MINLLKTDLFRVLRTKIVYISLIIAVILPAFIVLVNGLTGMAITSIEPAAAANLKMGDSLITSTFSPLTSFSYIFAVFPVIVIMMDFANGTLRNKIIHGYTRHQIYASHFIVILIYVSVITILHALTNVIGAFILGVSEVPSSIVSAYLIYYFVGFLGVIMVTSISSSLALSLNNAGAVVLTIICVLFFNYVGNILGLIFQLNHVDNVYNLLCFFPSYYIDSLSTYMSGKTEPTLEGINIIGSVSGVLIVSGAFYALGTFTFNKKDFK